MSSELEAQALAQFDALVEKGELLWTSTEEMRVEQYPFDSYFRISPVIVSKPYNPNSQSRRKAFQDDDPAFTLCHVGDHHKLILNKYCWVRPQLILHTIDFQPQQDLVTQADFDASWDVLKRMGDHYMVLFNGGADSGSSIAHKHLQIIPRPEWKSIADRIADGSYSGLLPFVYRQVSLSNETTSAEICNHYQAICNDLNIRNNVAHSLLLTSSWLAVIPRKSGLINGEIPNAPIQGGSNAMLGMQWLKSVEQLENWKRYGPMNVLREFGVASKEDVAQLQV